MRIVLATHFYPAHGGGIELVAGRIAALLASARGWDVHWYASDCDPSPRLPGVTAQPMRAWNGIERLTGLPYPVWSPASLRRLARGIAQADAVHIHEFAYLGSLAALRTARRSGVPLLLTQHVGAMRTRNPVAAAVYRLLEAGVGQRSLDAAAAVAFVSESTRRHFEQRAGTRPHYETIWNGVDTSLFHAADAPRRQRRRAALHLGPEQPVVLFAGRRVAKKGIRIVEAVARACPGLLFLVAGQGPEDPQDWGLANVRSLGFVAPQDMPALYQAVDLLLLPSYGEGYPLVVQEALACGTAVLTTDEVAAACPPAASLVDACPVPSTDDPAPWIRALRSRPMQEDAATRNARAARAGALWSWTQCAAPYAALFERVTALASGDAQQVPR